jgi:predicted DsbA family dithiol-disulfide isomerase
MKIEIWSDLICPWCYIGKRRLEAALEQLEGRQRVQVIWRSFELDPHAPRRYPGTQIERLAQKYGVSRPEAAAMIARVTAVAADEGLHYRLEQAQPGNTFDAHRLVHFAGTRGLGPALMERLMQAYFTAALPIGDPEALVRVAADGGLDPDATRAVLAGDAHAAEVRADEQRAARLNVRSVPHFLFDERHAVSGAQPLEALLAALQQTGERMA